MKTLEAWTLILYLVWPQGENEIAFHDIQARDRAHCISQQVDFVDHYRADGAKIGLADCEKKDDALPG